MDDDDSLQLPQAPPPPPLLQNVITNKYSDNVIPYLFSPQLPSPSTSLAQHYYPTTSSLGTQNSQYAMDNIDWMNTLLSGNYMINGDQMSSSSCTPILDGEYVTNFSSYKNKQKAGGKNKKSVVPPRVAFHTRSSEDILDDAYKWRKYGQKSVKHSKQPRSYYRCTHHTCDVKKQIQRLSKDKSVVVTTYEGVHNHPCEKLMETLSPLLRQLQFLSRF